MNWLIYIEKVVKSLYNKIRWGISSSSSSTGFIMRISCLLCLRENPSRLCDYSHQVVKLRVIYISNRFINWGQVEVYLLPNNLWGEDWQHKMPEPDSKRCQRSPLKHHLCVNLAKDRVTKEVVTAKSWILSPQCQNLTEYVLSYMSWGLWIRLCPSPCLSNVTSQVTVQVIRSTLCSCRQQIALMQQVWRGDKMKGPSFKRPLIVLY